MDLQERGSHDAKEMVGARAGGTDGVGRWPGRDDSQRRLPTLGRSLDASTGQLQWFVAAYTLVFAAALVPGGMLGDRYGRKKLLVVSLAIFGAASIACALAPSADAFIISRALLGLGGAIMFPMVLGLLPVLFDEAERRRAIAAVTAAAMLGYPIGPLLGGWMLTRFDWSWVFLINLPVVALALVAVAVLLPESRSSSRQRIDLVGVALRSRHRGAAAASGSCARA